MDCDPGSAVFVACNCVFHRQCLEEWRGLKDREKVAKADVATESIKSQRDALQRLCAEAEEQLEGAEKQAGAKIWGFDGRFKRFRACLEARWGENGHTEPRNNIISGLWAPTESATHYL